MNAFVVCLLFLQIYEQKYAAFDLFRHYVALVEIIIEVSLVALFYLLMKLVPFPSRTDI